MATNYSGEFFLASKRKRNISLVLSAYSKILDINVVYNIKGKKSKK